MAHSDPFAAVAAQEEFVAAACAAVAHWVPAAEPELHALAASHLAAAVASRPVGKPRSRRWLTVHVTLRAMLAAVIGTELGALVWLRRQEQRLIDGYVKIEASATLTADQRRRLRRERVPAAFERFQRVDRWIMMREEQGAYA